MYGYAWGLYVNAAARSHGLVCCMQGTRHKTQGQDGTFRFHEVATCWVSGTAPIKPHWYAWVSKVSITTQYNHPPTPTPPK